MPFGISLAPEEFECRLHEKLSGLEGVEIVRDDILVVGYGDTKEQAEENHDHNLRKLLDRAREVNLKLNSKKMNLKKEEVKFMGHVISKDGLKPDPDKVRAVKEMPKPTSKQETRSLLGFVNYLAKFLPRLSEVAQPLRDLTTDKTHFLWSHSHPVHCPLLSSAMRKLKRNALLLCLDARSSHSTYQEERKSL